MKRSPSPTAPESACARRQLLSPVGRFNCRRAACARYECPRPETPHRIPGKFPIVIAEQETNWFRALGERPRRLTCVLRDPAVMGMRGAAGEVHAAGRNLDEEQHVQAPEPDRIDGEEVNGDDTPRLHIQELMPRWPLAPTRWTEMFLAKDRRHRGRKHHHAQPFQLAHDALVTPARILARDRQNEVPDLTTRRPAAGSATVHPALGRQPPMPVDQCGRLDEE